MTSCDPSKVLDSMMNRTIGSSNEQAVPTTSTNASGTAATSVTSVTTQSVVSPQPVVTASQPTTTAKVDKEGEEVRSKLSEDTATNEGQSSSQGDQVVPVVTDPPKEGSNTSTTAAVPAPAEEQRRPRLTIRLVHRPRGAPRCEFIALISYSSNS